MFYMRLFRAPDGWKVIQGRTVKAAQIASFDDAVEKAEKLLKRKKGIDHNTRLQMVNELRLRQFTFRL
ncbi:hypothetical protein Rctr85_031 [Virus Rctr85]|nr:hypothetical protein Rctr85_031 [Virus Rctr85]